jgi:hypothetical protein
MGSSMALKLQAQAVQPERQQARGSWNMALSLPLSQSSMKNGRSTSN